jgi:putative ABC transport system substrate-binding protein
VIVTGGGTAGARAAMQATKTIPLVTPAVADPIGAGLVTNLAHPGGNFTGLSMQNTEISAKRLELLKAVVPGIVRVGVLRDPGSEPAQVTEVERAAGPLGVRLDVLDARGADDFDAAFAEARKRRVDAMLVLASSFFNTERRRLVELAAVHRLPAIYEQRDFAKAGGLVSYGPDIAEMYRRASTYVDKILKGAKPGDLPIEQPTKFELVVNVKTAKALKLAIPQAVLLRADEVIE